MTLISSHSSGSSYLNRVELQNGCLALGHTNLFIQSTLGGTVFNPDTGKVDDSLLRENMEVATSVYIDRVNNSPCGNTVIHLYRGADSSSEQKERASLTVFLKGSKANKEKLEEKEPRLFEYFNGISRAGMRFLRCHSSICLVSYAALKKSVLIQCVS